MASFVADTNIFLRFFLRDHKEYYQKAADAIQKAEEGKTTLVILSQVIIELFYVLTKTYHTPKNQCVTHLQHILTSPFLTIPEREILLYATNLYSSVSVDFVDCYLASYATHHHHEILSFDRDYKKLLAKV